MPVVPKPKKRKSKSKPWESDGSGDDIPGVVPPPKGIMKVTGSSANDPSLPIDLILRVARSGFDIFCPKGEADHES